MNIDLKEISNRIEHLYRLHSNLTSGCDVRDKQVRYNMYIKGEPIAIEIGFLKQVTEITIKALIELIDSLKREISLQELPSESTTSFELSKAVNHFEQCLGSTDKADWTDFEKTLATVDEKLSKTNTFEKTNYSARLGEIRLSMLARIESDYATHHLPNPWAVPET